MANEYYDNLMKFGNIEIIDKVNNKMKELAEMFSLKKDTNGDRIILEPSDVANTLTNYYFYRDGNKLLKEVKSDIKQEIKSNSTKELDTKAINTLVEKEIKNRYKNTFSPEYNKMFGDFLKSNSKTFSEAQYEALYSLDPFIMKDVEKIFGTYNSMKSQPTILVSCVNLEIDNDYIDITYQINQEIGTLKDSKLIGVDAKGKDKTYKIEQDTLFVDKINYDNTMDLVSLDGNVLYGIKIEDILSISDNIDKDKLINLKDNITNISVNDFKNNNIDKIMILENTIEEEKNRINNKIIDIS